MTSNNSNYSPLEKFVASVVIPFGDGIINGGLPQGMFASLLALNSDKLDYFLLGSIMASVGYAISNREKYDGIIAPAASTTLGVFTGMLAGSYITEHVVSIVSKLR